MAYNVAYTRLSVLKDGLAVERQEADARDKASTLGWGEIAAVYCDPDHSAYKLKRKRPDFERLLVDLHEDKVDGVVIYDLDRLLRHPKDCERLLDEYDRRPFNLVSCQGSIDISTSTGRFMLRTLVNVALKSSEDTARRVQRKHLELAQRGIPVGGHRPFGWQVDKRTLEPTEASLIRLAIADVMAGTSYRAVIRQWNEAGVTTTRGNLWGPESFKDMLKNPRLAGYRTLKDEIVNDADGVPVVGQWEPILTHAQWEEWMAFSTTLTQRSQSGRSGSRKYLLSGIVRCAYCHSRMNGNWVKAKNMHTYVCQDVTCTERQVCNGPHTDSHIVELVVRKLQEQAIETPEDVWSGEEEMAALLADKAEVHAARKARRISASSAIDLIEEIEADIAKLDNGRQAWLRQQTRLNNRPLDPGAAMQGDDSDPVDVERRRLIVQSVLKAVIVHRPNKKGPFYDPTRLDPVPQ